MVIFNEDFLFFFLILVPPAVKGVYCLTASCPKDPDPVISTSVLKRRKKTKTKTGDLF